MEEAQSSSKVTLDVNVQIAEGKKSIRGLEITGIPFLAPLSRAHTQGHP